MPLTVDDVSREVRAVFAITPENDLVADRNAFCKVHRGDARCDRHYRHHGRHAHLTGFHFSPEKGWWTFARVVVWK